jgi:hypothetical protein
MDWAATTESQLPPIAKLSHHPALTPRSGSVPAGPLSPSPYTQASQSIPTQLTGMAASTDAHIPPAKAGHLSHSLTHLPRHILFFPLRPIATLRAPVLGLRAPTSQTKLLPTQTLHSYLTWKSRSPSNNKLLQVSGTDMTPGCVKRSYSISQHTFLDCSRWRERSNPESATERVR